MLLKSPSMKHKDRRQKEEDKQFLENLKQASEEIKQLNKKAESVKPGDVVFTAEDDLLKLWTILVISFTVIVVALVLVSRMSSEMLLQDFEKLWQGRIFQVLILLLSGVLFFSICYFMHDKFILRITLLQNQSLSIKTWRLGTQKERVFEKSAWIVSAEYHQGKANATIYSPVVNAPYITIRPYGLKKKYFISEQGSFPFGRKILENVIR